MPEIPLADCPEAIRVTRNVPMAHVEDVDRASQFYALLGFACNSRFSGENGVTNWALMRCGEAEIMLSRASGPIDPRQQAVLFYMYSSDVAELRRHLLAKGVLDGGHPGFEGENLADPPIAPAVFEILSRFYMPAGELRIHDPDGYCILVGQLD